MASNIFPISGEVLSTFSRLYSGVSSFLLELPDELLLSLPDLLVCPKTDDGCIMSVQNIKD